MKYKNPFDGSFTFTTQAKLSLADALSGVELMVVLPDKKIIHYATESGYEYEDRVPKEYKNEEDWSKDIGPLLDDFEKIEDSNINEDAIKAIYDMFPEGSIIHFMEF